MGTYKKQINNNLMIPYVSVHFISKTRCDAIKKYINRYLCDKKKSRQATNNKRLL